MVEHRAVAAGVAGSIPVVHPSNNVIFIAMNIERFPTQDTKSQAKARELLEKYPKGTKEYTELLKDLEWFYDITIASSSNDLNDRARADSEIARSNNRYRRLGMEYGMELTDTELRDLIYHLKEGVDSFPEVEKHTIKRAA